MQREGQARQGCLKRVCPRALQGRKANQAHTDARPTKNEWDRSSVKFNPHRHGLEILVKHYGQGHKRQTEKRAADNK